MKKKSSSESGHANLFERSNGDLLNWYASMCGELIPLRSVVSIFGIGRFGPFEVDVVAEKIAHVQWECDSGIQ